MKNVTQKKSITQKLLATSIILLTCLTTTSYARHLTCIVNESDGTAKISVDGAPATLIAGRTGTIAGASVQRDYCFWKDADSKCLPFKICTGENHKDCLSNYQENPVIGENHYSTSSGCDKRNNVPYTQAIGNSSVLQGPKAGENGMSRFFIRSIEH